MVLSLTLTPQKTSRMMKKTFRASGTCSLHIAPVPASRPRVGRWGTYYGKNYARWKEEASRQLRDMDIPRTSAPLAVRVEQICKRPKTTRRSYPTGDCDNHVKGPLDALTQADGAWDDDDQIVWLEVTKRYAKSGEEPRSVIEWMEIQS